MNLAGFKNLSLSFTNPNNIVDDLKLTEWIDSFIEFLHSFKNKKYWTIITDKDNGFGIWLNQNNDFCKFQDVREDKVLIPELIDLAAKNRHINKDYKEELFTLYSSKTSYIETPAMELREVATFIDKKIEDYDGNKQDVDFRSLVFSVGKICSKVKDLEDLMEYYKAYKNSLIVWSLGEGTTMDLVGSIVRHGDEKLSIVKDILDGTSLEDLKEMKDVLNGCPNDKIDKMKKLINKLASEEISNNNFGDIPLNSEDETDIIVVPKTYELEVEDFEGNIQIVKADQVQYAGLSLEEIECYVEEAKGAVVKYFRELNESNPSLGLQFDNTRIAKRSYSQLYGISDKNGNEIPIVVHSYKGPQYRYFNLNWYDWQLLSRDNSMLFILTISGLQCIPLYALPVRNFNISISNELSNENKAALLTLATVGKQYATLSFDFGNNMPTGFKDPLPFNYVPEQLSKSITSIKNVCDQNIPLIANMYNCGKNIPLVECSGGYSQAIKAIGEGNARDIYDAPANDTLAPSVGTSFID